MIVGAGQTGLITAHRLLQRGADVTIATSMSSVELRTARAQMTQLTLPSTLVTERELRLDMWASLVPFYQTVRLTTHTQQGHTLSFTGDLGAAGAAIDPRVKLPDWLEYFEDQGGKVVIHGITVSDLAYFTRMFDGILVTVGSGELGQLFPADPSRPLAAEDQVVSQVYMVDWPAGDTDVEVYSLPQGEIYVIPTLTAYGPAHSILVTARPGDDNPLDLTTIPPRQRDVHTYLGSRLATVLPDLAERYAQAELLDERAALCEAVTPVVRTPVARVGDGFVVGLGDALVTTEPRTGQGWNLSTRAGVFTADRMVEHYERYGGFSEAFFTDTFSVLWEQHIQHTAAFSHMVHAVHSGNLPPELMQAMARAGTDTEFANAWVRGFDDPRQLTAMLSLL
ncbi:styrene monooxygenase/indole monooxygenase family protein [Nocardiopsis sp. CNR-923]|uniref:styrene monooxygenase/indole monooxygenase family protein n=1 Tax=Nocardiopsis sp. CNR-923 TaxID=1904965 RepID=UPI0021CCA19A|nr:styrene monooxygenase/indole monooxygenase family protein [Nocardiopsis sp. CNR-923]